VVSKLWWGGMGEGVSGGEGQEDKEGAGKNGEGKQTQYKSGEVGKIQELTLAFG